MTTAPALSALVITISSLFLRSLRALIFFVQIFLVQIITILIRFVFIHTIDNFVFEALCEGFNRVVRFGGFSTRIAFEIKSLFGRRLLKVGFEFYSPVKIIYIIQKFLFVYFFRCGYKIL